MAVVSHLCYLPLSRLPGRSTVPADMQSHEPFWDFSLRIYAQQGVSAACLKLQDEFGVDINLLLYCCWLGSCGSELDEHALRRALDFSAVWAAEVVHPLRRARRWMKDEAGAGGEVDREARLALRERIKAAELAAEQMQQVTLAKWGVPGGRSDKLEAAATNLRSYVKAIGIRLDDGAVERLVVILGAVLPEAAETDLRACARSIGGLPALS